MSDNFEFYHHGILGMKWGIRRWQNEDGSLTPEGREHYGIGGGRNSIAKNGGVSRGTYRRVKDAIKIQKTMNKVSEKALKNLKKDTKKLSKEEAAENYASNTVKYRELSKIRDELLTDLNKEDIDLVKAKIEKNLAGAKIGVSGATALGVSGTILGQSLIGKKLQEDRIRGAAKTAYEKFKNDYDHAEVHGHQYREYVIDTLAKHYGLDGTSKNYNEVEKAYERALDSYNNPKVIDTGKVSNITNKGSHIIKVDTVKEKVQKPLSDYVREEMMKIPGAGKNRTLNDDTAKEAMEFANKKWNDAVRDGLTKGEVTYERYSQKEMKKVTGANDLRNSNGYIAAQYIIPAVVMVGGAVTVKSIDKKIKNIEEISEQLKEVLEKKNN